MQQTRFLKTTERSFVNSGAMSETKAGSFPGSRQGPQQRSKGRPTQGPPTAGEGSQEKKVHGRRHPTTNKNSYYTRAQVRRRAREGEDPYQEKSTPGKFHVKGGTITRVHCRGRPIHGREGSVAWRPTAREGPWQGIFMAGKV